jgi:hypothetical protein
MDADLDMANRTSQAPHIKWMRENKKMIRVLRVLRVQIKNKLIRYYAVYNLSRN